MDAKPSARCSSADREPPFEVSVRTRAMGAIMAAKLSTITRSSSVSSERTMPAAASSGRICGLRTSPPSVAAACAYSFLRISFCILAPVVREARSAACCVALSLRPSRAKVACLLGAVAPMSFGSAFIALIASAFSFSASRAAVSREDLMRLRAFAAPGASERPGCRLAPTEPLRFFGCECLVERDFGTGSRTTLLPRVGASCVSTAA